MATESITMAGNKKVEEISREVMRIQAGVLAMVCAVLGGLLLFLMTVWLVVKDGPGAGPHLALLGNYFIGYSVTWGGSILGLFYGALTGGFVGWVVGVIYNLVVGLRQK
ncbi:MAG TPA: hypothetical protein PLK30_05035 [Blastocatellia bacterium]|nr:hypothetical protein [Blastocatellia bacterium]